MKVGDLVRWKQESPFKRGISCLPETRANEKRWTACGLVEEICGNGNINVMWPNRGHQPRFELVAAYFLEVVS